MEAIANYLLGLKCDKLECCTNFKEKAIYTSQDRDNIKVILDNSSHHKCFIFRTRQ